MHPVAWFGEKISKRKRSWRLEERTEYCLIVSHWLTSLEGVLENHSECHSGTAHCHLIYLMGNLLFPAQVLPRAVTYITTFSISQAKNLCIILNFSLSFTFSSPRIRKSQMDYFQIYFLYHISDLYSQAPLVPCTIICLDNTMTF